MDSISNAIYSITCLPTQCIYIGQTSVETGHRWYQHKQQLNTGWHCNSALQAAWDEYGESAFSFEIIEKLTSSDREARLSREQYWIKQYASEGRSLYNSLPEPKKGRAMNLNVDVDASEEKVLRLGAALAGETLTSFVSNAALERAERLLAENHISL